MAIFFSSPTLSSLYFKYTKDTFYFFFFWNVIIFCYVLLTQLLQTSQRLASSWDWVLFPLSCTGGTCWVGARTRILFHRRASPPSIRPTETCSFSAKDMTFVRSTHGYSIVNIVSSGLNVAERMQSSIEYTQNNRNRLIARPCTFN